MGCPELDMTSYFRFVRPDENPCERLEYSTGKTAYSRFSRTVTDDPIGNRITSSSAETGSTVTRNYTSNQLNQYTAINNPTAAPTYDEDGNTVSCPLSSGNWTMTWDCENRMISAIKDENTKLEFKYDYASRRVEKKVYSWTGSAWQLEKHLKFVYYGFKCIEVLDGTDSNSIKQKFVWSGERLLSVTDSDLSATYYYFADTNKNVGQLVDSSGNIKAKYEYSPFGKITSSGGDYKDGNPFRFSSEYFDPETGLVYFNFRFYDPEIGKWLNRDPIEEWGGYNFYTMVENNPINWWDYLGLGTVELVWLDAELFRRGGNTGGLTHLPTKWDMDTKYDSKKDITCCWFSDYPDYSLELRIHRLKFKDMGNGKYLLKEGITGKRPEDNVRPVYITAGDYKKAEDHEYAHKEDTKSIYNNIIRPMLDTASKYVFEKNATFVSGNNPEACKKHLKQDLVKYDDTIAKFNEEFNRVVESRGLRDQNEQLKVDQTRSDTNELWYYMWYKTGIPYSYIYQPIGEYK